MNIIFQEVSKAVVPSPDFTLARNLFVQYFLDLYQGMSPTTVGIASDIPVYLEKVFDGTEQALQNNSALRAFLAYHGDDVVGFTVFGPLEDAQTILVRTLPINLAYKDHELTLRVAMIEQVRVCCPAAKRVIIMVRKANVHHMNLCLQQGCVKDDMVFTNSEYIGNTYDSIHYDGLVYTF